MTNLKEIPGAPNYFASEDGVIWSRKRKGGNKRLAGQTGEPLPLKVHLNRNGYQFVNFDINGKTFSRSVHRLILETFIGPCPPGHVACHYPDSTKTNNHLSNLRWDTILENAKDKYRDRIPATEKFCKTCGIIKSKNDFYGDKRRTDGLKTQCKKCHIQTCMSTRDIEKKRFHNRSYYRRKRQTPLSKWRKDVS